MINSLTLPTVFMESGSKFRVAVWGGEDKVRREQMWGGRGLLTKERSTPFKLIPALFSNKMKKNVQILRIRIRTNTKARHYSGKATGHLLFPP